MIARKDFTQKMSIKGPTRQPWPHNLRHGAVPEGPYRIFSQGCCCHPRTATRPPLTINEKGNRHRTIGIHFAAAEAIAEYNIGKAGLERSETD
jgi:hypothetical protein